MKRFLKTPLILLTYIVSLIVSLSASPTFSNDDSTDSITTKTNQAERPNIVLIMCDDLGFADLGFQGGEIRTPNLDALAKGGIRFSQFHNNGRCCPTRATLMTGLPPHLVGIGHMTNPANSKQHDLGVDGYRGFLNDACVTTAEVLKSAGYATLMAGKWHLGYDQKECWPLQRGFDKYYGCIEGATRFFHPTEARGMVLGNERVAPETTTDKAFYTTDAFTDYGIRFIREHFESDRKQDPFFLYLAYTAPHWPLQAFEEDIARYRGKYKLGWDELRKHRYQKQIDIGLIDPKWPLSPRAEKVPAWDSLSAEKQDEMDLKMAVYAAMVDRVDQRVGSLVQELKDRNVFENTLIIFLSDNGGCQEGGILGRGEFYDIEKRNLQSDNSYGEAWANASNTPFRLYKHFVHEGGSSTPFFMHWPAKFQGQTEWYRSPAQLIDILPTFIDLAGATYPKRSREHDIPSLPGISLRPAMEGKPLQRDTPIFMEHENNASVRDGVWKLVGQGVAARSGVDESKWELYNIAHDRTELNNLASEHPERVKEMAAQWMAWANANKVYPKGSTNTDEDKADPNPPQIANKALTITATVRNPKPHGVVISQGGLRFGYSLHFIDGRPAFSVRNDGVLTEIAAEQPVKGKVTVVAKLTTKEMSLEVDGQTVASGASNGLIQNQPALGLYRGLDFRDPVGSYKSPNTFNGRIINTAVEVAAETTNDVGSSDTLPSNTPSSSNRPASGSNEEHDQSTTQIKTSDATGGVSNRTNIVIFLSDDHTWRDSSLYGSPDIKTPNMDRIAATGITFDNAYVVSPSCAPSRAALLTGVWPSRSGAEANHSRPDASIKRFPAYLQELGYEIVSFGKVGHYRQIAEYGFDSAQYFNYHEDIAVPKALEWLKNRRSDKPLCLIVGTNWPHVPWPKDNVHPDITANDQVVPPNHVDTEVTKERRARYVAAIRIMDNEMGQVFDLSREKLGENTLFLHTSDHGAQWPFGKWTLYDDGIRTPMIASWPKHIAPGTRSQAMISWIDILPTIVEVAGGNAPTKIDGKSFLDVMLGKATEHRDLIFATHSGDGDNNVYPTRAVINKDGWKYIRNLHPEFAFTTHITNNPSDTGYWPSWSKFATSNPNAASVVHRYLQRPAEELYYVPGDKYEKNNLATQPEHAEQMQSLSKALDQWMQETGDPQKVFGKPKLIKDLELSTK